MTDPFLIDADDGLAPSEAARAALELYPFEPVEMIHYVSHGRLLVLGNHEAVDAVIDRLPKLSRIFVALTDDCNPRLSSKLRQGGVAVCEALIGIDIQGWLGRFRGTAISNGGIVCLEKHFGLAETGFDLVLDLCEPTVARSPIAPIGYFAAGFSDSRKLAEALEELPQCVGNLEKPKYVLLDPERCDHRTGGVETCRRCCDVCGTWAIATGAAAVSLNPYLCQGCGDCATACPAGAIRYNYPPPEQTLLRIQRMLETYFERGGKVPILLLHDAMRGREWLYQHRALLPINVLPYELEALAATGMDTWLMALAMGATEILLLDTGDMSEKTRTLLQMQIDSGRAILKGIGYPPLCLRLAHVDEVRCTSLPVHAFCPIDPLLAWSDGGSKRTLIREAVGHLRQRVSCLSSAVLPEGAPFGVVRIDPDACTLCMDCTSVCPEAALVADGDRRGLAFIEARCVQCKACANTCRYGAITVQARYLYDDEEAASARPVLRDLCKT
jgi:ferredoxin